MHRKFCIEKCMAILTSKQVPTLPRPSHCHSHNCYQFLKFRYWYIGYYCIQSFSCLSCSFISAVCGCVGHNYITMASWSPDTNSVGQLVDLLKQTLSPDNQVQREAAKVRSPSSRLLPVFPLAVAMAFP